MENLTQLPFHLSLPRLTRIALALGILGVAAIFFLAGPRNALGFLIGAALSLVTVRSWFKLAQGLGADGIPGGGAAVFLVLRYAVIAAVVYATIKILGSAPGALIAGLLVSFAAMVVELLFAISASKKA